MQCYTQTRPQSKKQAPLTARSSSLRCVSAAVRKTSCGLTICNELHSFLMDAYPWNLTCDKWMAVSGIEPLLSQVLVGTALD